VNTQIITTVIPTYRRPRLLSRAICSVLKQSFPHFEVHVFDNASGDETPEVVAKLAARDPRVKYHCHSENIGLVRNFIFAVEQVQTPFFNILSDDDIVLPDFFESAIRVLTDYPEVATYIGATIDAKICGAVVDVPVHRYRHGILRPPEGLFEILRKGHTNWTGFMIRRKELGPGGGLDEQVDTIFDVDFQLRLAAQYAVFVSPSPAAVFFSNPEQASGRTYKCIRDEVFLPWNIIISRLVALHTLDRRQANLARNILTARLRRSVLHAGGEVAALASYSESLKASEILKDELDGAVPALCLRGLCTIAQVIPANSTRFLAFVLEQILRVSQKRRYGLSSRLSVRDRKPYVALVRESIARLAPLDPYL